MLVMLMGNWKEMVGIFYVGFFLLFVYNIFEWCTQSLFPSIFSFLYLNFGGSETVGSEIVGVNGAKNKQNPTAVPFAAKVWS